MLPAFLSALPGGNRWFSSSRLRTGPFTRNGSVGNCPWRGPGSAADGREVDGERVGEEPVVEQAADDLEVRLVVEPAVSGAGHRRPRLVQARRTRRRAAGSCCRRSGSRPRSAKSGLFTLRDRDLLAVVAEADRGRRRGWSASTCPARRPRSSAPSRRHDPGRGRGWSGDRDRCADCWRSNGQVVLAEREGAVQIVLRQVVGLDVLVLRAELDVVVAAPVRARTRRTCSRSGRRR